MSRSMKWPRSILAGLGALLIIETADAATLQVDRRGQTPGAYTTLAAAAAAVQAGDTIELVAGSGPYRETLEVRRLGTKDAPIIVEGNGELVTGFNPFQFTLNLASLQWEYTLPPPLPNTSGGSSNTFRHLVTYQGRRLLISRATGTFTSDLATLSADGLTLILGAASATSGWEIGTRLNGLKVSVSNSAPEAIKLFHTYRNLRVSGAQNDGFNLDGYGTEIRFENIEAFHNFDDGFSAHGAIQCSINGGAFWGNDNGLYNQSKTSLAVDVNNVRAYANLGVGISMRAGSNRLTNSQAWDNGVANISLGGSFVAYSVSTYLNRWPQPLFANYQESQGQNIGQVYPYTYDAYWKGKTPDATHQAYVLTGEEPRVLPLTKLPPFALTYADWRYIYFSLAQIADGFTSGELADPDTDGRNNLDEYREGTRPLVADAPAVIVAVTVPDAVAESFSGDPGTIVLRRSGETGSALTVYFSMSGDATPGSDYVALENYVEIPAGSASAELSVVPAGNGMFPVPKLVVLGLVSDPAYLVGPASGTVELDRSDLPVVTLMVPDNSASEAAGEDGLFRIWRSGSTAQALTVPFLVSGSATPGDDYQALDASIDFPAGIAAVDVPVIAVVDGLSEVTETVTMTLTKTGDYELGGAIGTVKIEGGALSTITLTATDASAGEAPGETGTFTITRSSGIEASLTVFFSVAGSATPGDDYAAVGSSAQIPAGASSVAVVVAPVADSLTESAETVVATLSANAGYVVGTQKTGTVTISSGALPTVSVTTIDSTSSEAPGNVGTFSLARTGSKTTALTVAYNLSGTADNGVDYTSLSGTAVIPEGSGLITVTISPMSDTLIEGSETAVLTLSSSAAYVVGAPSTGTVTIADVPPPTITLVVNDGSASESGGNSGLITVSRTGSKTAALVVSFALTGTATPGDDYTDPGVSLEIPAGASFATLSIAPLTDSLTEGSESVVLSLVAKPHYSLGTTTSGTVTIADVVAATLSLSVIDDTASEGGGDPGSLEIRRSGSTSASLSVNVSLAGSASADVDYNRITSPLTIPAGASSLVVSVVPMADSVAESAETVSLSLAPGSQYGIGSPESGTVTIYDAAPASVSLMATDAAASEAPGNGGEFLVSRSGSTTGSLTVHLAAGGTATPTSDYAELPASIEIPDGSASVAISVAPVADTVAESSETVTLSLVANAAYVLGASSSGTVTIANVVAPTVSVVTNDGSASEAPGNGGVLSISRTGAKTAPLTVRVTLGGTASAGVDYADVGTEVVIPAGSSSISLAISPLSDALTEGTETVVLSIAADTAYALGSTSSGTVNILDVPLPTVSVTVTDALASEGGGDSAVYSVTRSGSRTAALMVNLILGGTATEGVDYSSIGTQVSIPAGAGSVSVFVSPLEDLLVEESETVELSLSSDDGYVLGASASGTTTIADAPPLEKTNRGRSR